MHEEKPYTHTHTPERVRCWCRWRGGGAASEEVLEDTLWVSRPGGGGRGGCRLILAPGEQLGLPCGSLASARLLADTCEDGACQSASPRRPLP